MLYLGVLFLWINDFDDCCILGNEINVEDFFLVVMCVLFVCFVCYVFVFVVFGFFNKEYW